MASKYAQLSDCEDPLVTVDQSHLAEADVYVDGVLWARGINPAAVALPNAQLTALAVTWAFRIACIKGAVDENSPLKDKAKEYLRNAELLAGQITRESLGLVDTTTSSGGYGSVRLGRG